MQNGQVLRLRYSVAWVDQHPLTWVEGAFPADYEVKGWRLQLGESQLEAWPPTPMGEDEARLALLPILSAWAASLEVEHHLIVTFTYLGAEFEPESAVAGEVRVQATDVWTLAFDATVEVQRGTPPEPSWDWQETPAAAAVREVCLRPLRNGTRPVADAAYWLATHLKMWAGGQSQAASRLNVDPAYFERARQQGARSAERKVSNDSVSLTEQQKESLRLVLEDLVARLYLVESGLTPGERLTLTDWPS
ncbi:hypothetical protein GCM10010441_72340 [Kitasatospora paracochleata]|uniref:Uncharacterized protein n=1 Tax=Kitasatospora paracochleata TaxID=58354 RepID=A0ABT1J950_9ACTN|nr:hypothetical protein [Kitasatospora paracochleata]MCP2313974.1 hypothetical protein [Kitasatospora paracochleata]